MDDIHTHFVADCNGVSCGANTKLYLGQMQPHIYTQTHTNPLDMYTHNKQ